VAGVTEQLTTADGRRLAYRRLGSGPTLVCHPGGPGFSSLYLSSLGGLDRELELVLLDPRGTGASDPARDPAGYAIDDYAADLEELRRHLGLERMPLLGHSHGGVTAIAYAARHPEHVERLILASTLPRHGADQEAAMQAAIERRSGQPWYDDAVAALEIELAGAFADGHELMELVLRMMPLYFARYGEAERAYVGSLGGEHACVEALRLWETEIFERFDLRPLLPRLAMPTLVITGAEDFITGPSPAAELVEGLPEPELVVLPDAGHMIFVEAPDAFREAVLSFLGVGAPA
jgi:pimeloyl-ACP methyl ester carboxylesterase